MRSLVEHLLDLGGAGRLAARTVVVASALGCAATPTPGVGDDDGADAAGAGADAVPAGGCGGSGEAAQPFGNHAHGLAVGSIVPDHRSRAQLDDAVRLAYSSWKSRHLEGACNDGRYFVKNGDGDATVSEATGYGMVVTAYMAGYDPQAREVFDGLFQFATEHPSSGNPGLMSWSVENGCGSSPSKNSAADGDLDIAYALLLADKQWGSGGAIDYRGEAARAIAAIRLAEVDSQNRYVRLGDWTNPGDQLHFDATRSSDFMPGHFASFQAAVGDGGWSTLLQSGYGMVAGLQAAHAPGTGLVPDFVVHPGNAPAPAPGNFLERPVDGAFSFNACRVPLRLGVHFLTSGDARARTALQKLNEWLKGATGGAPDQIKSGYWLDGNVVSGGDFRSNAFVGPLGVGAMVDASNQAWLDGIWDLLESSGAGGYYDETLKLMSMIAISGNWWSPETAPCPR